MTDQKCLQCGSPFGHEPVSFISNLDPALGGCHLRCVNAYHHDKALRAAFGAGAAWRANATVNDDAGDAAAAYARKANQR